jgi:hypothetical protein
MLFDYCDKCKDKECQYTGMNHMIYDMAKDGYKLVECPDKKNQGKSLRNKENLTADMTFENEEGEKIYVEHKTIRFPKGDMGHEKRIWNMLLLISDALDINETNLDIIRNKYTVVIKECRHVDLKDSDFYYMYQNCSEEMKSQDIRRMADALIDFLDGDFDGDTVKKFTYKDKETLLYAEIEFNPIRYFETKNECQSSEKKSDKEWDKMTDFIITYNGIDFELPVKDEKSKTKGVNIDSFIDVNYLSDKMFENLKHAKNSFYGVEKNRYVVLEVVLGYPKFNILDSIYATSDDISDVGNALLNLINAKIHEQDEQIKAYNKCYDKIFLCITLGIVTYIFELL